MIKSLFSILLALLLTPSLVFAGNFSGIETWIIIVTIAVQFLPIVGVVFLAVAILLYFIEKGEYRKLSTVFGILSVISFVIYGLYYFLVIV